MLFFEYLVGTKNNLAIFQLHILLSDLTLGLQRLP